MGKDTSFYGRMFAGARSDQSIDERARSLSCIDRAVGLLAWPGHRPVLAARHLLITLAAVLLVPASASAASLLRMPAPGGAGPQLQFKPHVFTTTGDGSAYLGGFTGHRLEPRHLGDIGHLTWTSYGVSSAAASGQIWGDYGFSSIGGDRQFEDQGHVSVRAYDPAGGVFQMLTVHYAAETFKLDGGRTVHNRASTTTFDAIHADGFWYWTSPIDVDPRSRSSSPIHAVWPALIDATTT